MPTTQQKLTLNEWLRICRFWYNRQLGERFNWWSQNRCPVNACPLVCHLPSLKERPNYYSQKKQLPLLKKSLVTVEWSGEELNFVEVPSLTLQEVCKRVDRAFSRYISGDSQGKRSGKPRFFFHEKLNLKGLSQKNQPIQDAQGKYLPNKQSAKSGLNKSWLDAAFGQFFSIFNYIAEKAGVAVIEVNPAFPLSILNGLIFLT